MKTLIRAFVVALFLTGAAASTHLTAAAQTSSTKVILAKTSALPVPMCPPDDPNGCGGAGTQSPK